MTAKIYDKRTKFTLRVAKNIAKLPTEEQRSDALLAVNEGSRKLVEATVKAMLSHSTQTEQGS